MWNMSAAAPFSLRIGLTGLDICARDPESNHPNTTYCSMPFIPKCPSRCPTFWENCAPFSTCTERAFTPRVTPVCTTPVISCPLPQPGVGFECNHGTWIFLGDNSGGTITLPPSAGPVIIFGNLSTNGTITFSALIHRLKFKVVSWNLQHKSLLNFLQALLLKVQHSSHNAVRIALQI